jgi:hypothetical protein
MSRQAILSYQDESITIAPDSKVAKQSGADLPQYQSPGHCFGFSGRHLMGVPANIQTMEQTSTMQSPRAASTAELAVTADDDPIRAGTEAFDLIVLDCPWAPARDHQLVEAIGDPRAIRQSHLPRTKV